MPNVSFIHPLVRKLMPQYELIRDCLAGENQVKFRRSKYLPIPNGADTSEDNMARYNAYIERAVFYNVAKRTQGGLVGQIFMRDPVVKVPAMLDDVIIDATGSGVPLEQLASEAASFALGFGRTGLYIDYPARDEEDTPISVAELETGEVRPTMKVIPPWDCINYRVKQRGAKIVLSLVVFREDYIANDDGFETKIADQWRVLRLDENDEYVIEIYRNKIANGPEETFRPKGPDGKPIDEIAFSFVGAISNDPKPQEPPMYDLCSINMAHYRNSADYEENVFIIGQPTPWFSGLTEEWVTKVLGGSVALGARGAIMLPVDGEAGLLQVEPNTLAKEAMDQKEAQMLALGAKLVEGSQVERTATEADYDNTSENSILANVAKNVGSAVKWALEWAAYYVGASEAGIEYSLNTEFDLTKMTPDERRQLLAEWQAGGIAWEEYRENLRRGGIAKLDDKAARTAIDNEAADALARTVEEAGKLAKATNVGNPSDPAAE